MFRQKRLGTAVAVVAAALLLLGAIGGRSALAGPTTTTPTISVSPNPMPLGTASFVVSGSGFSGRDLSVGVPGVFPSYTVTPVNGAFSFTFAPYDGAFPAGAHTIMASKWKGHTLITVASTTFTVCPTNPC